MPTLKKKQKLDFAFKKKKFNKISDFEKTSFFGPILVLISTKGCQLLESRIQELKTLDLKIAN
jgi:helix-turn-helix protein